MAGAAGRAGRGVDAGRQRREDRGQPVDGTVRPADHEAVTALEAPDAAAGTAVDVVDVAAGRHPRAVDVVAV